MAYYTVRPTTQTKTYQDLRGPGQLKRIAHELGAARLLDRSPHLGSQGLTGRLERLVTLEEGDCNDPWPTPFKALIILRIGKML